MGVPANSWETVPDCCGCHAGAAGAPSNLAPAPSPAAVSPSSGVSPTPGPPWQTTAACNANAACRAQGLDGNCCPTSEGSMLGCCSEHATITALTTVANQDEKDEHLKMLQTQHKVVTASTDDQ